MWKSKNPEGPCDSSAQVPLAKFLPFARVRVEREAGGRLLPLGCSLAPDFSLKNATTTTKYNQTTCASALTLPLGPTPSTYCFGKREFETFRQPWRWKARQKKRMGEGLEVGWVVDGTSRRLCLGLLSQPPERAVPRSLHQTPSSLEADSAQRPQDASPTSGRGFSQTGIFISK